MWPEKGVGMLKHWSEKQVGGGGGGGGGGGYVASKGGWG